jgi:hypothetical protein
LNVIENVVTTSGEFEVITMENDMTKATMGGLLWAELPSTRVDSSTIRISSKPPQDMGGTITVYSGEDFERSRENITKAVTSNIKLCKQPKVVAVYHGGMDKSVETIEQINALVQSILMDIDGEKKN